jgi:predicted small lipoprotein YifL
MRRPFPLAALLLTMALGACGTRGPLYLPPPRIKPPVAAPAPVPAADPATPAEPIAVDLNTSPEVAQ